MWSPLYWYFEIRSDEGLSHHLMTKQLLPILKQQKELAQTGLQVFSNNNGFPWISVTCAKSTDGSYSHRDSESTKTCNLIAIVGSKSAPSNYLTYLNLLVKIANAISWELILEEDDDGNKNIILNK